VYEKEKSMDLTGKKAIVTGAGGAIGRATSIALAACGAQLILVDNSLSQIDELARQLDCRSTAVQCDLSMETQVHRFAEDTLAETGAIDILVNNAGILSNNKIADTTLEEWRAVNAVNVEAAYLLTKALLPTMRKNNWGRIINVSSYAAKSGGLTAGTAYTVSKSAMLGLTFSIALEAAADGVTVNAVAPAYVMSPMVMEHLSAEQRQRQLAQIPVGRFCAPDEVAHTISFLASPLAGFITGEVIDMNGGMHFD
jgi:3-oxoacyl-[acyl-carrier protein] reductase